MNYEVGGSMLGSGIQGTSGSKFKGKNSSKSIATQKHSIISDQSGPSPTL